MSAFHGLDVAAVLGVVLVWEGIVFHAPVLVAACHPLIPAGNEYELRVELECPVPLLGEVQAVHVRVGPAVVALALGVAAAVTVGQIERRAMAAARIAGVLGYTDRYLLIASAGKWNVAMLRVDLQPPPLIRSRWSVDVVGLAGPEREELADLTSKLRLCLVAGHIGEVVGIGHDERLTLPEEPQVAPLAGLVEVRVEVLQARQAVGARAEGEHEDDLRRLYAVLSGFGPYLAERLVLIVPGEGSVGAVEEDCIHLRSGEHFGVFA